MRLSTVIKACLLIAVICGPNMKEAGAQDKLSWTEDTFEDFTDGQLDASGKNLYATRKGTIETITRFDLNGDGYLDLVFTNIHDIQTEVATTCYEIPAGGREGKISELSTGGSNCAAVADLNKDGFLDAVLCPNDNEVSTRRFLFVFWGSWTRHPVLDVNLFRRNRVFAFSNLAALIHYSATFAIAFLLSLYLQLVKGMSPRDAGLAILVQPLMMAFFSPMTGRLSDRIEPQVVASIGMAITTAGLAALSFLTPETDLILIVWALVIIGIGYALFSSPNTNAVMSSVEPRAYGVASGTIGTMRLLGQVFSMGIATVLFAVLLGREQITPDLHDEFMSAVNVAFGIFSFLCFLGIWASLARGKLRD